MCYPIVAINRGVAQFGRAPRSGRGGRKFKSCHLDQKEAGHSLECPASFFCLFARFELATRGSKCAAFGRNSPGDCFAASALYFCARLLISAGGAAGMSCFLFCLFTRFELATRGSKCVAFGRNSPGDCFAASALYLCADYSFLPVEQPKCPASFFVYLQDLNLRHEAPNAKHLAETVRGTVSQQVPYISVLDYAFLPVEQHVFSGVAVLIAVLGHARYKKSRAVLICSVRPVG